MTRILLLIKELNRKVSLRKYFRCSGRCSLRINRRYRVNKDDATVFIAFDLSWNFICSQHIRHTILAEIGIEMDAWKHPSAEHVTYFGFPLNAQLL